MVLLDGDGNVLAGKDGQANICIPPLLVENITADTITFAFPHQLLSPKNAAELADVHKATVQRAVIDGDLPKPARISPRRIGHKLADVLKWTGEREAGKLKVDKR